MRADGKALDKLVRCEGTPHVRRSRYGVRSMGTEAAGVLLEKIHGDEWQHYCHRSRYQNPSAAARSIAVSLPRVQVDASRLGVWYAAAELGLFRDRVDCSFRPNLNLSLGAVGRCGVHLRPDQPQPERRCDCTIRMELRLEL